MRDAPTSNALRQHMRQAVGLGIYRSLATFALLVAGFSAFPDHRGVFGFSVIAFNLGVSGIIEYLAMTQAVENQLMDAGERKTRFTTLVAAERVASGEGFDEWAFWDEVNRRVAAERKALDDPETPPHWYQAVGLTVWNVVSRMLGDLLAVGFALVFSGG